MVSPSTGLRFFPEQCGEIDGEDVADNVRSSLGLCNLLRSVSCLGLVGWVQRLKERNQRGNLSGIQIFAIGRHVAATLDHLPHQLIVRPGQPMQRHSRHASLNSISSALRFASLKLTQVSLPLIRQT